MPDKLEESGFFPGEGKEKKVEEVNIISFRKKPVKKPFKKQTAE
jgi:hypothetical protein